MQFLFRPMGDLLERSLRVIIQLFRQLPILHQLLSLHDLRHRVHPERPQHLRPMPGHKLPTLPTDQHLRHLYLRVLPHLNRKLSQLQHPRMHQLLQRQCLLHMR